MLLQIAIGSGLMLVTLLAGASSVFLLEALFTRARPWLEAPPHRPKQIALVIAAAMWSLVQVTVGVWVWAAGLRLVGAFPHFEEAMYFALVTFTTLGYGDVIPPERWRILGAMGAANGLLNFGLMTALLVEVLRHLRLQQKRRR